MIYLFAFGEKLATTFFSEAPFCSFSTTRSSGISSPLIRHQIPFPFSFVSVIKWIWFG